jgi:serine protease Do
MVLLAAVTTALQLALLAQSPVATPTDVGRSVAPLVDQVKESVVTIRSIKNIPRARRADPFGDLMREQMGLGPAPPSRQTQQGLGSGFIVDERGTIYTNNHVVAGADEVQVVTSDGRVLPAKVEGRDPATDVAVIRLTKPPSNLKVARLGNSEKVRVGDYVLAIGNPLGLGQTVTMGIVSAKNRSLDGLLDLSDFIQTDAAINQGNSGGPLFNFAGEVVGINSAILNPAMAMNVGFAIPINLAKGIADQLVTTGRVGRGFLGITSEPLTPDRARALGMEFEAGALVNSVGKGTPAAAAGIKPNDVVVEVAGRRTETGRSLTQVVQSRSPGETLPVVVVRGGKRITLQVKLTENLALRREDAMGMGLQRLTVQESVAIGLRDGEGVKVVSVEPRSMVSGSLQEGDVIAVVTVQGRKAAATVESLRQFEERVRRGARGQLVIVREGEAFALNF